jgi:hypothetical protein
MKLYLRRTLVHSVILFIIMQSACQIFKRLIAQSFNLNKFYSALFRVNLMNSSTVTKAKRNISANATFKQSVLPIPNFNLQS